MPQVQLSGGALTYREAGESTGQPVVFIHGVFVDSTVWRKLEKPLVEAGLRFIAPDLPLGAHHIPLDSDADVSPVGVAQLVREFLGALDLEEVMLVGTDTGGAITQLVLAQDASRVSRVVLTPCDSFENFLPAVLRPLKYAVRVPGLVRAAGQGFRLPRLRRLGYGTLARFPIPDDVTAAWVAPLLADRGVRRDIEKFCAATDSRDTLAAAERLRTLAVPVLLLWPQKVPFFPHKHAQRWLELLPDAALVDPGESYTLVSEDQPEFFAQQIISFAARTTAGAENRVIFAALTR